MLARGCGSEGKHKKAGEQALRGDLAGGAPAKAQVL